MAGVAVSKYNEDTVSRIAIEVFEVTQSENDTTVITPTKIKEILSVDIIAKEAVAAANLTAFHLTNMKVGAATVTLTSLDVASNFAGAVLFVKITGKIA